jgi:hypothetical protein
MASFSVDGQADVISLPTRDQLADETKQLGKSHCKNV